MKELIEFRRFKVQIQCFKKPSSLRPRYRSHCIHPPRQVLST
jgi:hypothetical protein